MAEPVRRSCVRSLVTAALVSAACGSGSPITPTATLQESRLENTFRGQTISASDAGILAGVTVQLGMRTPTTSDVNGYFSLNHDVAGASLIELSGPAIVPRQTTVQLPSNGMVTFGLIPATFDLPAFDEMFRGSQARLQRWLVAPSLVVLTSVMQFENSEVTLSKSTGEEIPSDEVAMLVHDLRQALADLTANSFSTVSVSLERTAAGMYSSTARDGQIVIGRYKDLKAVDRVIGYGRCAERSGVVTAGSVALDALFDATSERRRLLRAHELGHALGYKHVTVRQSSMNLSVGSDITGFDRQGAAIAFQRPPGNHAPDADPPPAIRAASSTARWSAPVE
jgi:hypothetical protein